MKSLIVISTIVIFSATVNAKPSDKQYNNDIIKRTLNSNIARQKHNNILRLKQLRQYADARLRRRQSWGFTNELHNHNNAYQYTGW
jgi:hypothetical protein